MARLKYTSLLSLILVLTACGGGGGSSETTPIKENILPTVNAGSDQSVDEQTTVNLSMLASDTDGSIASYKWSQITGLSVTLTGDNSANTSFTAPSFVNPSEVTSTTLTFEALVIDNDGGTSSNSITITVNQLNLNSPIANAGDDQTITGGQIVTLDGSSSSDVESSKLTYNWVQTDNTAIPILIDDSSVAQPHVTVPEGNIYTKTSATDQFTFKITVTDAGGLTGTDTVNLSFAVAQFNTKVNDTGLTLCGDYTNYIGAYNSVSESCSDTVDADGDPIPAGQDGHYGRDITHNDDSDGKAGFSFTKLDANGDSLPASAIQWSCVQDNFTGLIWEVKTTDGDLRDAQNTYTWYSQNSTGNENGGTCPDTGNCDTEKYMRSVNSKGLCGKSDWRLPNKEALRSIVDYDGSNPSIDVDYFPNTRVQWYWSSSPYASNNSSAWIINFSSGRDSAHTKSLSNFVRLVRAGD